MTSSASGPTRSRYDVVVAGAGLGGLSAAACLARVGKAVLVVEQGDGPGGYARPFRRGPYTFDPAIHVTASGSGGLDFWDAYLGGLGIIDHVDFVHPSTFYGVVFPGQAFDVPPGIEPFIATHKDLFPDSARGIEDFVRVCVQVTHETQQLSTRLSLEDLGAAMQDFPMMFRYRTASLAEVLDEYLDDDRPKAALAAAWPYMGVPPSSMSFVQFAALLAALMEKGPVYAKGSFGSLVDALVGSVERDGGEIVIGRAVTGIVVEGGRAGGVVLEGGDEVAADVVVSNVDARTTLEELVGPEHLPERYLRRLGRMTPSISAFAVYSAAAIDLADAGISHETFVYDSWDHEATYRGVCEGRFGGTWLSIPTLHDPSLAPDGEHLFIFTSLMPCEVGSSWEEIAPRLTEQAVDAIERLVPGFRDAMTHLESAHPDTFARYTRNSGGAAYGWANTPSQSLPKRLGHRTPVEGLFLAGHWTEPGAGSFRTIFSGLQAAGSVMAVDSPVEMLGALFEKGNV